jgi:hypothetical protein
VTSAAVLDQQDLSLDASVFGFPRVAQIALPWIA